MSDDPGHDEESLEQLVHELRHHSLDDLRTAMQHRLADKTTSSQLSTKQATDAYVLLLMIASVLQGHGEVTESLGHGNWSELRARSYPDDEVNERDPAGPR